VAAVVVLASAGQNREPALVAGWLVLGAGPVPPAKVQSALVAAGLTLLGFRLENRGPLAALWATAEARAKGPGPQPAGVLALVRRHGSWWKASVLEQLLGYQQTCAASARSSTTTLQPGGISSCR